MTSTAMRRGLSAVAIVPLLVGLSACGSSSKDEDRGTAANPSTQACGPLPSSDAVANLPSGFPSLPQQKLYDPSKQGSTTVVFGLVNQDDFVGVRDNLVTKLKAAGYTVPGTDQEAVEAEAEFQGKQNGTIKVQPYCKGYVTVRYKFNG